MTKDTTEILKDQKWTILKDAWMPFSGLGIATVNNEVFAFGKKSKKLFLIF